MTHTRDGRYGPQTPKVEALIQRARTLTGDEADALLAARYAAYDAAYDAARYAAWDAARYAARDAAWYAARDATRYAAWDATCALVVRDLIGQHGLTQAHYDALTGPWRRTVGPIHPDDEDLRGKP